MVFPHCIILSILGMCVGVSAILIILIRFKKMFLMELIEKHEVLCLCWKSCLVYCRPLVHFKYYYQTTL